jgi:hypothetical protein
MPILVLGLQGYGQCHLASVRLGFMGYSTGYKTRFEKRYGLLSVLVICGGVPLMGWRLYTGALMSDLLLKAYVLTAPLFGWLLAGDYPPVGTRWFWKAMVPVFLMHSAVLYGLVQMTLYFADSGVKLPARMVWGLLAAAVIFEYFVSLRIIRALGPTEQR